MIKILSLLLLMACSQLPSGSKSKTIPVSSEKEARLVIQNHVNYMKSVFQQAVDPYYKVEKWSKECLVANKIGEIHEDENSLVSFSEMYLQNMSIGKCPGDKNAELYFVVYFYCKGADEVVELKVPALNNEDFPQRKLCH